MEIALIGATLGLLVALLIKSRLHPALLFVCTALLFVFLGFLTPEEMLGHFTNETLITLLLLLHVSGAVEKTRLVPLLSRLIFVGTSLRRSVFRLSLVSMLCSSVLNNTAIVATLIGVVRNNPRRFAPSKLLIPLSYAAIMGGVLTLVGTSTNLIVNSFAIKAGLPEIGFFDFLYVGAPIALVGLVYLTVVLPLLLPRKGWGDYQETEPYFLEAVVSPGSPLIGKSISQNKLREMEFLYLAELVRDGKLISPISPDMVLEEGDSLVFTGDVSRIQNLTQISGLELQELPRDMLNSNLQEVVIRHNSPLVGRRIRDVHFRTKFDAAVVAVRRGDEKLSGKIGDMVLQTGDDLVLAAGPEFYRHENLRRNFSLLNAIEPHDLLNDRQSIAVVGLFLLGIGLTATGVLSLFKAMALLLLLFLALGFLKFKHLKNNLNISLLLMIGSALGIAQVITEYGLAQWMSEGLLGLFGTGSPWLALGGIYLSTLIITELVTNNAAAALMFPIALATAQELGVSPTPFIMVIAFAASASFLTPIGYQTNTLVYSVGKYRFADYFRGGLALSVLYAVMVVGLVPYMFPF